MHNGACICNCFSKIFMFLRDRITYVNLEKRHLSAWLQQMGVQFIYFLSIRLNIFRFAYIEFADKEAVETAMALDGTLFRGRQLQVTSALLTLKK